ncbi:MAG: dihydrolipoyl dehydrogenase [Gammaproteobacteria bacterium]|nr:dihydrolipoyl dehydrogenase [Gammaproteobacteria bacterium]
MSKIAILGAGPGGYSAAFRAADLGLEVTLIEQSNTLGGTCLNVGCIPSKTLLHLSQIIDDANTAEKYGVKFIEPEIDLEKIRAWKDSVVGKLTAGLAMLAKLRKINIVEGEAKFTSANSIEVTNNDTKQTIEFDQAIIASGSSTVKLPFLPEDERIMDSTSALALNDIPKNMLIIGGGIIGLEMATFYHSLGSEISIVEFMPQLASGADLDVITPLQKKLQTKCKEIMLETKVVKAEAKADGIWVTFEGENAPPEPVCYDKLLVAVGRRPNGKLIDADKAGVSIDERGFIPVNDKLQTNVPNIFAIGDIIGNPMLAHKAVHEGRLAAEIINGSDKTNIEQPIPAVAYTTPELAWIGKTEQQLKENNIAYEKAVCPWMASGRALSMDQSEGFTKLLIEKESKQLLGAAIVGPNAGDLIAELALAITNKLTIEAIAHTIHPHPTLSETNMLAAELYLKTATDLPNNT